MPNQRGVLRMGDRVACTCDPKCLGKVVQASTKTFVNNRGVARMGDRTTNCCGCSCPCPNKIIAGSTTVFVDNRPIARVGDAISFGKSLAGSTNVFAG